MSKDLLKIIVDAELKKDASLKESLEAIKKEYGVIPVEVKLKDGKVTGLDDSTFKKLQNTISALEKKVKDLQGEMGKSIKTVASDIKGEFKNAGNEIDDLGKKIKKTIKEASGVTSVTTGDQFRRTTTTLKNEERIEREHVYNFKAVNDYYSKILEKSKEWSHLTSRQREKFNQLLDTFHKLGNSENDLGREEFIRTFERLEGQYKELEQAEKRYQLAIKKRQEALTKISKLRDSEGLMLTDKDFNALDRAIYGGGNYKGGLTDLKTDRGVENRYKAILKLLDELQAKNKNLQIQQKNEQKLLDEMYFVYKDLNQLKSNGILPEDNIRKVQDIFTRIRTNSEHFAQDLKIAKDALKELNAEEAKQRRVNYADDSIERKKMDMEIFRLKNIEKAQHMLERGIIPEHVVQDFVNDVNKINEKSNKLDLESKQTVKGFTQQETDTRKLTKTTDDYIDSLVKLQQQASKELSLEGYSHVEKEINKLIEKAKQFKQEQKVLTYDDDRTMSRGIKSVKEQVSDFKKLEANIDNVNKKVNDYNRSLGKVARNAKDQLTDEQYEAVDRKIHELMNTMESYRGQSNRLSNEQERHIKDQQQEIDNLIYRYKQLNKERTQEVKLGVDIPQGRVSGSNFNWGVIDPNDIRGTQERIRDEIYKTVQALHRNEDGYKDIRREMIQVKASAEDLAKGIYRIEYQVDRGNRKFDDYRITLDTTSMKMRDLGQRMNKVRREMTGMEQLFVALNKVPLWASATGVVYGGIHQIRRGFDMILEMDREMTNLSKVVDDTSETLAEFQMNAIDMGKALGVAGSDVVQATTEFARLGYSIREASALAEESLIYANVGDMDVESAHEAIISAVKGFSVEIDETGESVRRLVDIFNEVGNNFAISSDGIGEALKRSSAILHQAGNSIEQSVALVTAANTTIQNPTVVGNALKTVAMRLRGVDEEGKEIVGLIPEIEKAFNRFGGTLMEDEETFKSTYDMMGQLAENWERLSDIQRAQITEMIGGKRQGSIVASMIENWSDAVASYETGLNSAGSAQREFSKYQESMQYRLGQLKASVEEFWNTFYNDEAVKMGIDGLRSMVELLTLITERVGMIPVMLTTILAFLSLSNNHLREIVLYGKGVFTLGSAFGTVSKGAGMAFTALWRLTKLTVPLFALTFTMEKVGKVIFNMVSARQRHLKVLKEEYEQTQSMIDAYDNIDMNRYRRLTSMDRDKMGIEERQELLDIQEQLEGVMPQVVRHYDEEGRAVYRSADAIERLIDVRRREQKQREAEIASENIKQRDYDDIQQALKAYSAVGATPEDIMLGAERFGEYIKNEYAKLIEDVESMDAVEFRRAVAEVRDKMELDLVEIMGEDAFYKMFNEMFGRSIVDAISMGAFDNVEQLENRFEMFMADVINQTDKMSQDLKDAEAELTKAFKETSEDLQAQKDQFIEQNSKDIGKNEQLLIERFTNNYIEALKVGGNKTEKEIEQIVKDFREKFLPNLLSMFDEIEGKGIDLKDLVDIESDSFDDEIKNLVNLRDEFSDNAEIRAVLQGVIEELRKEHDELTDSVQDEIEAYEISNQRVAELNEQYQEAISSIRFLNGAKEQLIENNRLDAQTMMDIMNNYPQLVKYLGDEEELQKQISKAIEEQGDIARDVIRERLYYDRDFFEKSKKANADFFNELKDMYGVDLKNWKSIAQAKAETDEALIASLGEAWSKFYKIQADGSVGYTDEVTKLMLQSSGVIDDHMWYALEQRQKKLQSEADRIAKRFDEITVGTIDVDFNSIGVSDRKDSKSGQNNEPNYQDPIDAWITQNELKQKQLDMLEEEINNKIRLYELDNNQKRVISETNKLLSNRQKRLEETEKANEKIRNKMSTVGGSDSWLDENGEATLKYINAYNNASKTRQEEMDKQFNRLQKLKKAYIDNSSEINSLNMNIAELQNRIEELNEEFMQGEIDRVLSDYRRQLSPLEYQYDRTGEMINRLVAGTNKYSEELKKQEDLLRERARLVFEEREEIKRLLRDERLSIEQKQELRDLLNELSLSYQSLQSSIFEIGWEQVNNELERFNKTQDQLNYQLSRNEKLAHREKDFSFEYLELQGKIIRLHEERAEAIFAEREEVKRLMREEDLSLAQKEELKKMLNDLSLEYQDALNAIFDTERALYAGMARIIGEMEEEYIQGLRDELDATVKQLEKNIEDTEEHYDNLIEKQKERLKQLDEEIKKEDRLQKIREINDEIEKTKNDRRFSYITADGEEILTYNRARVSELEQERDDMLKQFEREDLKKAIQDEIDRLEEAKKTKIETLREEVKETREQYDILIKAEQERWKELRSSAEEGTVKFQDILDTFYNNSSRALDDYVKDVQGKVEQIRQAFLELGEVQQIQEPRINKPNDKTTSSSGSPSLGSVIGGIVGGGGGVVGAIGGVIGGLGKLLSSYHEGGVVGVDNPNRLTSLVNKMFQLKHNEQVIKSLKGELQVPPSKIPNLFDNIQAIINSSDSPAIYQTDYHLSGVTIKADDPEGFFKDLDMYVRMNRG